MKFDPLSHLACAIIAAFLSLPALADCSFQKTLTVSGPVYLDVTTGSGNISLHSGNSNEVQICGHVKAAGGWFAEDSKERISRIVANPPIQQSGNDVRIGHLDDPTLRKNISISYEIVTSADTKLDTHTGSGDQRVQGIHGPLEMQSGSGNLQVENIGSNVKTETGSGDITLTDVKGNVRFKAGSGNIRATAIGGGFDGGTGSGDVTLEQTTPGSVRVNTGSGNMVLNGVKGSVEAQAGSGDIHIGGDPAGAWTVRTGSGNVQLRFPTNVSFDLDAHTGSGSVSVSQPLTVQGSIKSKEIQGKVGGGGVPVQLRTGSGDIEIQ